MCDRDCFNCKYDDCIVDDITSRERREQDKADRVATGKSTYKREYYQKHKQIYYEANKRYLAKKKKEGK